MRRIHQVLSGVLTFAVDRKRIPYNPAAHTSFPTVDTEPMTVLTVRQVDAFVAAHPEGLRVWAKFLALTGLRVSEAAGLRVRDVDLKRQRVTVREAVVVVDGRKVEQKRVKTESSQGRRVPLVPELVAELTALVAGRADTERVFTGRAGASMNRANYSRRQFRAAVESIGMPGLHPHVLRHTAVSLAIASGASVKEVQAIAGHKDAAMTLNVYSHLFEDSLDRMGQRMADYLAAERAQPPRSPQADAASA
ncbi:MAG: site-specific integrase [Cellulomonas sp.]|nr:site-specific integrase [Cellulomonas sp.]MCR6649778.1 site-specific integrase [Cellulomonas sp.]